MLISNCSRRSVPRPTSAMLSKVRLDRLFLVDQLSRAKVAMVVTWEQIGSLVESEKLIYRHETFHVNELHIWPLFL